MCDTETAVFSEQIDYVRGPSRATQARVIERVEADLALEVAYEDRGEPNQAADLRALLDWLRAGPAMPFAFVQRLHAMHTRSAELRASRALREAEQAETAGDADGAFRALQAWARAVTP